MVAGANTGFRGVALGLMLARLALAEPTLVTVTVYVLVVVPFCAVITVVMVFVPTFSGIAPDAVPDATAIPFTFIVVLASVAVGVKVILVVVFGTLAA